MNFLFLKYNFCLFFSRLLSYLSKPFQLPVWYGVYVHHCYSLYAQDISVQVQYCTQYSLCTPLPFSVYSRYISSSTVLYTIQFMYTIVILCILKIYQFINSTVHNTVFVHHCNSLYAQDVSVQVQYCTQYSSCTPLLFYAQDISVQVQYCT